MRVHGRLELSRRRGGLQPPEPCGDGQHRRGVVLVAGQQGGAARRGSDRLQEGAPVHPAHRSERPQLADRHLVQLGVERRVRRPGHGDHAALVPTDGVGVHAQLPVAVFEAEASQLVGDLLLCQPSPFSCLLER
jgi:hypothetical protein